MTKRIVIVGGGVGGTIVANVVARTLHRDEAEIIVIDATGDHAYMPGWLYLPIHSGEGIELSRPERSLLNQHVQLVTGEVTTIDTERRELKVRPNGASQPLRATAGAELTIVPYDELVLGTGARLAPEDLPGLVEGLGGWHDFYSLSGALRLRKALHDFEGGRIVIAIGGIPYRCPPAPLEFAFLLEDWLGSGTCGRRPRFSTSIRSTEYSPSRVCRRW